MILVLLAIFLLILIVLFFVDISSDCEGALIFCGSIPFFITLVATILLLVSVANLNVIDQKIEMYEQENIKIERQVETAVKAYQEHEKDVFTSVKTDSYMQLVTLYPELKSDTLVKEQIKTYQSNNKKIKELKEKAIDGNVKRWWLYFGHKDIKY